jgi:hypothetical protein
MCNRDGGVLECSPLARELSRLGHLVRLIPPQYVKPYVKRNKTDAADAEAICEAVGRPNMRFVPIKTIEQQSILALHRVRALLVRQRTSAINAMRGLLSEFGIVAAKGIRRVEELRQRMSRTEPALLPDETREAIGVLVDHLDGLRERIDKIEARILALAQGQRGQPTVGVGARCRTSDGDSNCCCGGRRQTVQISTTLRSVAWVDAAHPSERGKGAHRPDQQGRRPIPSNDAHPWRPSRRRHRVSYGRSTKAVAAGAFATAAGKRRGHCRCP